MIHKLLAWKLYIRFLYAVTVLMILALIYFVVFTDSFKGVDGGLGLAAGIFYVIYIGVFIGVNHLVYLWLRHHPRVMRIYLSLFWLLVILGSVAAIFMTIDGRSRAADRIVIAGAVSECNITRVSWDYNPAILTIDYDNQESFVLNRWSDPMFLSSLVWSNQRRCPIKYQFALNGEVAIDPSMRSYR